MTRNLAYLDPGSAGVILQMIGGGIAASLVMIKLYGRRVFRFLRRKADGPKAEAVSPPDTR